MSDLKLNEIQKCLDILSQSNSEPYINLCVLAYCVNVSRCSWSINKQKVTLWTPEGNTQATFDIDCKIINGIRTSIIKGVDYVIIPVSNYHNPFYEYILLDKEKERKGVIKLVKV